MPTPKLAERATMSDWLRPSFSLLGVAVVVAVESDPGEPVWVARVGFEGSVVWVSSEGVVVGPGVKSVVLMATLAVAQ